jgi:hypothetical protein
MQDTQRLLLPIPSFLKERTFMSRQQRLIYLQLVGTILLYLLVGVCLAASMHFSKSTPSTKVTKQSVKTPADDAIKYWTANRMRKAKAVPLPKVNTLDREKQVPRHSPHLSRPQDA